jgi:hypothetical protein
MQQWPNDECLCQLTLATSERGDQPKLGPTATLPAKKCYGAPIRRPRGASILGWICGQAQRLAGTDQFDVDIEFVLYSAPYRGRDLMPEAPPQKTYNRHEQGGQRSKRQH